MKTTISTENAPAAIGPYNQAVEVNGLIYTAGQIPLDPATGQLVDTSFADRVHQVMKNLKGILEAAGSDFSKVIKATIFVTDLGQFAELNGIYAEYFQGEAPARSTVEVAALPMGTDVEIEMVAHK